MYQATDTKLNRQVALKILPEAFAADPDRLARFQREAEVLASLNHPGIAAIYGIEEADDTRALVLELVEGPTLADRVKQGPIPADEALPIAKQIAEALEAAHEAGVIHRDLKPANIKVKDDGTVKVLDFGLAKALDTTPGGDPSQSPTLTAAATQMGVIMGTAAYMSPEQARGKTVDKRADIWAFGCVLYEMLTSQRPFGADEVSDTLAFVLTKDLEWSALPADSPAPICQMLRRCLEKDARRRLRDIGEARLILEDPSSALARGQLDTRRETTVGHVSWWAVLPWAVAALTMLVAFGIRWPGGSTFSSPSPGRFQIPVEGDLPLREARLITLSPDGRELVYRAVTDERDQLYRRPMNTFEATPVRGSEGAVAPFFPLTARHSPSALRRGCTRSYWPADHQV